MYTFAVRDKQGNWFLSQWTFKSKKAAEEEAAHLAEYDFITEIRVFKKDSKELTNLKSYLN
jgi:hypothetical protein